MAYDANSSLVLASLSTVSASVTGTAVDLGDIGTSNPTNPRPGTPRRGMTARILIPSATCVTPGAVVTFQLKQSDKDGTVWTNLNEANNPITLGTAVATPNPITIPFNMTKQQVRLDVTFSATTGSPVVAYSSQIGISWPD